MEMHQRDQSSCPCHVSRIPSPYCAVWQRAQSHGLVCYVSVHSSVKLQKYIAISLRFALLVVHLLAADCVTLEQGVLAPIVKFTHFGRHVQISNKYSERISSLQDIRDVGFVTDLGI